MTNLTKAIFYLQLEIKGSNTDKRLIEALNAMIDVELSKRDETEELQIETAGVKTRKA